MRKRKGCSLLISSSPFRERLSLSFRERKGGRGVCVKEGRWWWRWSDLSFFALNFTHIFSLTKSKTISSKQKGEIKFKKPRTRYRDARLQSVSLFVQSQDSIFGWIFWFSGILRRIISLQIHLEANY